MLETGTKAIDFTLPDENGNLISLHDFFSIKSSCILLSKRFYSRVYKAGMCI